MTDPPPGDDAGLGGDRRDAEGEARAGLREAHRQREDGERLWPERQAREPPVRRGDETGRESAGVELLRDALDEGADLRSQDGWVEDVWCRRGLHVAPVRRRYAGPDRSQTPDGPVAGTDEQAEGQECYQPSEHVRVPARRLAQEPAPGHVRPIFWRKPMKASVGPASGPSSRRWRIAEIGVPGWVSSASAG
ncbi:MAG: hypothetical protein ACYDDU_16805 [Dermatophilaceae bacterium]